MPPICLGFGRDERGVIAILTALCLTIVIGAVGLAIDVGMWYRNNRAMQNAADAAVIAAALNGTASYASEAKAIAAQYGFVDGAKGVTVTALNNQTCPDGTTSCYQVMVAQSPAPAISRRSSAAMLPPCPVLRWRAARKLIPIA